MECIKHGVNAVMIILQRQDITYFRLIFAGQMLFRRLWVQVCTGKLNVRIPEGTYQTYGRQTTATAKIRNILTNVS